MTTPYALTLKINLSHLRNFRFIFFLKTLIFSVLLFLNIGPIFSQGEGNFWYFGSYAGLDFNGGTPSVVGGGRIYSEEGCASISESS